LRKFFEVSREFIVIAALKSLVDEGSIKAEVVTEAMRSLGVSSDKIDPVSV
jgi:pyruvate dehydrogenase E1 component